MFKYIYLFLLGFSKYLTNDVNYKTFVDASIYYGTIIQCNIMYNMWRVRRLSLWPNLTAIIFS